MSEVCSVLNNNGRFPEALFSSLFSGVLRWGIPQRCEISLLFTRQQMCETVAPGEGDWRQLSSQGGGGEIAIQEGKDPSPTTLASPSGRAILWHPARSPWQRVVPWAKPAPIQRSLKQKVNNNNLKTKQKTTTTPFSFSKPSVSGLRPALHRGSTSSGGKKQTPCPGGRRECSWERGDGSGYFPKQQTEATIF